MQAEPKVSLVRNNSYFKYAPPRKTHIDLTKSLSIGPSYIRMNTEPHNTLFLASPYYIGPYRLEAIPTIRITIKF